MPDTNTDIAPSSILLDVDALWTGSPTFPSMFKRSAIVVVPARNDVPETANVYEGLVVLTLSREATARVEETVVAPVMDSVPAIEDEAEERNPLWSVTRPVARKVEDTVVAPETESVPPMEDDAFEMNPLWSVERPVASRVEETVVAPLTDNVLPMLDDALEINPPRSVVSPATRRVPEVDTLPFPAVVPSTQKSPFWRLL